jgi:hypothetical protein
MSITLYVIYLHALGAPNASPPTFIYTLSATTATAPTAPTATPTRAW